MFTSIISFFKNIFKKSKDDQALKILHLKNFLGYTAYKEYFKHFIFKHQRSENKLEILQANTYILSHYKTYNVEYLQNISLDELNKVDRLVKIRIKSFDAYLKILREKFSKIKLEPIIVKKRNRGDILLYNKFFATTQLKRLKQKLEKQQEKRVFKENKKYKKSVPKKILQIEKPDEIKKLVQIEKQDEIKKQTPQKILQMECFICKNFNGTRSDLIKHMKENH